MIDPTSKEPWSRVERELQEAEVKLQAAHSETEFQSVGLVSREALGSLAREVYDPHRHATTFTGIKDGEKTTLRIGKADAVAMLGAYFDAALAGGGGARARKFAHAALALAHQATHDRSANFQSASLALAATQAVAKLVALLERRTPHATRRVSDSMREGFERDLLSVFNWIVDARAKLHDRQAAVGGPNRTTMFIGRLLEDLPKLDYWPKDERYDVVRELQYLVKKVHATRPMPAEVVGSFVNELGVLSARFNTGAVELAREYDLSLPPGMEAQPGDG